MRFLNRVSRKENKNLIKSDKFGLSATWAPQKNKISLFIL